MKRASGVLMHISSLPNSYSIGSFGKCAYDFVDFLRQSRQRYWQVLPLGPTSYGDSPYQSFSSFALNPYFIDFDVLNRYGLLKKSEYRHIRSMKTVDYEYIYEHYFDVLHIAFARFSVDTLDTFKTPELEKFALFMSIKKHFGDVSWQEWDDDIKFRTPEALALYKTKLADEINFWLFTQYVAFMQWNSLKAYANKNGVKIIGDIPIYVALDSADAWANSQIFMLDDKLSPTKVAGCPPDDYSQTGQLWGNPLYRWDNADTYSWWISRISATAKLYDLTRIDHFRGFDSFWAIPYGDKTAEKGEWLKGPGIKLFEQIKSKLGDVPIIAEDLGFLTKSVRKLLELSGYPGMKVLQFAFSPDIDSEYLPHNHCTNSIVYTGTHDNDTVLGWFAGLSKKEQRKAIKYLNLTKEEGYNWGLIRAAYQSVSRLAIIPMQDFLGLGSTGRMNIPSTPSGNWQWRCPRFSVGLAKKIRRLTKLSGR